MPPNPLAKRMVSPCSACHFATCKFPNPKKNISAPPANSWGRPCNYSNACQYSIGIYRSGRKITHSKSVACRCVDIQARVQEFVRGGGGGQNLKAFIFLLLNYSGGGAAQKMGEKMIFPTKKVSKYMCELT